MFTVAFSDLLIRDEPAKYLLLKRENSKIQKKLNQLLDRLIDRKESVHALYALDADTHER